MSDEKIACLKTHRLFVTFVIFCKITLGVF